MWATVQFNSDTPTPTFRGHYRPPGEGASALPAGATLTTPRAGWTVCKLRLSPPEQAPPPSVFLLSPWPPYGKQTCLESICFYFGKMIHGLGPFPDEGLVLKTKGFSLCESSNLPAFGMPPADAGGADPADRSFWTLFSPHEARLQGFSL